MGARLLKAGLDLIRLVRKLGEERVRYVTPVIQFRRTVTGDCELGGREFHRGDKVLLL